MTRGSKHKHGRHVHTNKYASQSHAEEIQAEIQSGEWDRRIQKEREKREHIPQLPPIPRAGYNRFYYISETQITDRKYSRNSLDFVSA